MTLSGWTRDLKLRYESGANNQFILHGNVEDRFVLPQGEMLGFLSEFLNQTLLSVFDVVLSYDVGNGLRIEKGQPVFSQWPAYKTNPALPREPRPALEALTHYGRFCANLARVGQLAPKVAVIIRSAHLVAPQSPAIDPEFGALALLLRGWTSDPLLLESHFASFLVTENLADLHPLCAGNPRAVNFKIPLPGPLEIEGALKILKPNSGAALRNFENDLPNLGAQLSGTTLSSLENLLQTRGFENAPLEITDIAQLKKSLIENDAGGLIEFIESTKTLDAYSGSDAVKAWLRADLELWRQNDLAAMPMGYLLCGPVGTGKTFLVECLAGEAGVPVVKIKNFRDKWIGSTEGNLEKIFRLLGALGRCYVFVDEADQALGKRDSGAGDGGIGGRVYGMFAQEMSRGENRGKIVWILASSRPDLIEVDLKRPGRIDVKIPLFPASSARESFDLIRALMKRRDLDLKDADFKKLEKKIPLLLTAGAAEALAVKVYRASKVEKIGAFEALQKSLEDYTAPVNPDVLRAQILLAIEESSDAAFVPAALRGDSAKVAL